MSHPFKRLLLATEHTEFDSGAERVALEMARQCSTPLSVVLPVSSNPEFEAAAAGLAERTEQEAAARMGEFEAAAKAAGVEVSLHARRGIAAEEIIAEAIEKNSDLIVIRRRGRRGFLAKLLIGEVVSRVVSISPCSVLMVPRNSGMWSRGILAALDGSVVSEKVASIAAGIAIECGLPLHLLSVAADESKKIDAERIIAKAVKTAEENGVMVSGAVAVGRPCDEILASHAVADLIIVGTGDVRASGTVRKVAERSEMPVLVVRG